MLRRVENKNCLLFGVHIVQSMLLSISVHYILRPGELGTCARAAVTVKFIPKSNQPSEIINEMKWRMVRRRESESEHFPSRASAFRALHVHVRL